jgi:alpha-1,2-mannosyltransferase
LFGVWAITWTVLALFATTHSGFDLNIYQKAIRWWWHGHDLYSYTEPSSDLGFTYPPFAAVALSPLAALPFGLAHPLMMAVNYGIILLSMWWLLRPVAARMSWPMWYLLALALPLVVALEPIRETLGFGQVNLVLAGLVGIDLVQLARGRRRGVGIGIGLAAAIKLTPAVFILFLFAAKRWRAGFTATATAVVATLLVAAADWPTSWKFWTETLWQTRRVGRPDSVPNQSLQGLLARLEDTGQPSRLIWFAAAVLLLVLGLYRAVKAGAAGDQLGAGVLTGLLSCALSPVSWTHHFVWVLPAVAILLLWAVERESVRDLVVAAFTFALFASSIVWVWRRFAPHHWDHGWLGIVLENAYILGVLVLIFRLPIRPNSDLALANPLRTGEPSTIVEPLIRSLGPGLRSALARVGLARQPSATA